MLTKIIGIQLIVILLMVAGGYAYFRYSQGVIATLHENNARLETAVKTQEETIAAQQAAAVRQNEQTLILQQNLGSSETVRRDLEARLRRANLEAMARANSADLERRMNSATERAFRDIEVITAPRDRPRAVQPVSTAPIPQPQPQANPVQAAQPPPLTTQPPPRPPRQYPSGGSR